MNTAYVVVTLVAIAANTFSGVAALVPFKPILPGMVKAGGRDDGGAPRRGIGA
jgi:hypothetical protein